MLYLTVQMLVLLLIALLIGAGIGWLLRGARDSAIQEAQANADAARMADLRRDRDAAETALAAANALPSEGDGTQLAELQSALEASQTKVKDLEGKADEQAALQAALKECQAASNALETERDAAQAALKAAESTSAVVTAPAAVQVSAAESKPEVQTLVAEASAAPDDLKLISGVGPKLEGVLHQAGITRFDQIANLTAAQITDLNDVLNFKGRIERDDWVGQATRLAAGEKP